MSEGRYYNIDALNKYDIFIPTVVHHEIVAGVLATIVAYEQGLKSIDRVYKRYEKQIKICAVQYEGPDLMYDNSV